MTRLYRFKICFVFLVLLASLPTQVLGFELYYFETDALGTPLTMVDTEGNRVWRAVYFPFGEERAIQETPESNDRRFLNKEKDKETGLTYLEARYMEANTGRFLSPDPVGPVDAVTGETNYVLLTQPQRLNRYAYGLNNPYRYVDPDGREIEENDELSDDADRKIENPFGAEPGADRHLGVLDPKHPGLGLEFLGGGAASKGVNALSKAAGVADRGSLTAAGRALQKHGGRQGSAFPAAKGKPTSINQQGQNIVDAILTTPGSVTSTRHHARYGNVTEVRAPDGRGVRYDDKGNFMGFLEPTK